MIDKRIVSLALALGLLLATVGPTFAMPVDGAGPKQPPAGLAKQTFVHYEKSFARTTSSLQTTAAAYTEKPCATSGSPTCPTYVYRGVHWAPRTRVVYYVDMNFSTTRSATLTPSVARAAVDGSFRTWGAAMPASGGLIFVDGGSTKVAPGRYDGRNVIGWGWLATGTLAVTTVWYRPSTGRIVEADMTLNNRYAWAYTPPTGCSVRTVTCNPAPAGPRGSYDLRNISTHEAGHMMMLGDLYGWSNRALTMYGYASANQRAKESLGTGDKLGVLAAY